MKERLRDTIRAAAAGLTLLTADVGLAPQNALAQRPSLSDSDPADRASTELAGRLQGAREKLASRGEYDRVLRNERLTREQLMTVFQELNGVNAQLYTLLKASENPAFANDIARMPPALKQFLEFTRSLPAPLTFRPRKPDGSAQGCNGFVAFMKGKKTFVTNEHCVEGTVREVEFFRGERRSGGGDIAGRALNEAEQNDATIQRAGVYEFAEDIAAGALVILHGFNYTEGQAENYPGMLLRVTKPMQRILGVQGLPEDAYAILLPQWAGFGIRGGIWTNGMSGSPIVLVPSESGQQGVRQVVSPLASGTLPEIVDLGSGQIAPYVLGAGISPSQLKTFRDRSAR